MKLEQDPELNPHSEEDSSLASLRDLLNTAIRGKEKVIDLVLACVLARGHLLLEDLPGLGLSLIHI